MKNFEIPYNVIVEAVYNGVTFEKLLQNWINRVLTMTAQERADSVEFLVKIPEGSIANEAGMWTFKKLNPDYTETEEPPVGLNCIFQNDAQEESILNEIKRAFDTYQKLKDSSHSRGLPSFRFLGKSENDFDLGLVRFCENYVNQICLAIGQDTLLKEDCDNLSVSIGFHYREKSDYLRYFSTTGWRLHDQISNKLSEIKSRYCSPEESKLEFLLKLILNISAESFREDLQNLGRENCNPLTNYSLPDCGFRILSQNLDNILTSYLCEEEVQRWKSVYETLQKCENIEDADFETILKFLLLLNQWPQSVELGIYPRFLKNLEEIFTDDFNIQPKIRNFPNLQLWNYKVVTTIEDFFIANAWLKSQQMKAFLIARPLFFNNYPLGDFFVTGTYLTNQQTNLHSCLAKIQELLPFLEGEFEYLAKFIFSSKLEMDSAKSREEKSKYLERQQQEHGLPDHPIWNQFLEVHEPVRAEITKTVRRHGNRSAAAALVGRNLSHHSGSHILYWLEHDARERARKYRQGHQQELAAYFEAKAEFYGYLRERMDLAAAFAIYLPRWTATINAEKLIKDLKPLNTPPGTPDRCGFIQQNIGRTEGVYYTDVVLNCSNDIEIAIPGGTLGQQAFYGIIENIARDSAKYGDLEPDLLVLAYQNSQDECRCLHGAIYISYQNNQNDTWEPLKDKLVPILESLRSNQTKRVFILLWRPNEKCSVVRCVARCPGWEKDLRENLQGSANLEPFIWEIRTSPGCHHELCRIAESAHRALSNGNLTEDVERFKRALLSITVDISELRDEDLNNLDESTRQETKDNLVKVVVYDDSSSYETSHEKIEEAITSLERDGLCDETGGLRYSDWGIKERYIFATYLRGLKAEEQLLPEHMRRESTNPPILRVCRTATGNLGWCFYLLKPKDILIVSNVPQQDAVPKDKQSRINVWDWETLLSRLNSSHLRHKFVILCPDNDKHLKSIENLLDYLPYRVFIDNHNLSIPEPLKPYCAPLPNLDLASLSMQKLYQEWSIFISRTRQDGVLPEIVINTKNNNYPEDWRDILSNNRPLVFFDRHGRLLDPRSDLYSYRQKVLSEGRYVHYEPYYGLWAAERWAEPDDLESVKPRLQEAGLFRILVIDERIDSSLDQMNETFGAEKISWRELWHYKGVDVKGVEYKGVDVPCEDQILGWVKQGTYDFVLVHQGILDKVHNRYHGEQDKIEFMGQLFNQMREKGVWHIIVFSGRGGITQTPAGVKFLHFSSIEAWFNSNLSKPDIVEELMSLRREEVWTAS